MILRIMLRPSHRSFAWLLLSRLLVIGLQAGKFRTIPAMKYRPAVPMEGLHGDELFILPNGSKPFRVHLSAISD